MHLQKSDAFEGAYHFFIIAFFVFLYTTIYSSVVSVVLCNVRFSFSS